MAANQRLISLVWFTDDLSAQGTFLFLNKLVLFICCELLLPMMNAKDMPLIFYISVQLAPVNHGIKHLANVSKLGEGSTILFVNIIHPYNLILTYSCATQSKITKTSIELTKLLFLDFHPALL